MSGNAACGARTVGIDLRRVGSVLLHRKLDCCIVTPEVTLKLSEWISVGVSAMLIAGTATGFAISLPVTWMLRPARLPVSSGLSAAPRA